MVKPLTFKGDKPKKAKKRSAPYPPSKPTTTKPTQEETAEQESTAEDQSWVSADAPSDIAGPVIIVLSSDPPTCIASDANGKVFASEIENLIEGDPGTAEPHDVRQVWVATQVAGTEGISFKGQHGKYVSLFLSYFFLFLNFLCFVFGGCYCYCYYYYCCCYFIPF